MSPARLVGNSDGVVAARSISEALGSLVRPSVSVVKTVPIVSVLAVDVYISGR